MKCFCGHLIAWRPTMDFREWSEYVGTKYEGKAMTPEGKVKVQIKELLKKYQAYWHMPVQNGMGSPALDFHVCHQGKYLGIEAKAPGKTITTRQGITCREIEAAGGSVFICDGSNLNNLELWLMEVGSDSR